MEKLSSISLRWTPLVCLLLYFGAIDRISSFNEELKLLILILFISISAIAAAILSYRNELKSGKLSVLILAILVSFLIFIFAIGSNY